MDSIVSRVRGLSQVRGMAEREVGLKEHPVKHEVTFCSMHVDGQLRWAEAINEHQSSLLIDITTAAKLLEEAAGTRLRDRPARWSEFYRLELKLVATPIKV